MEEDAFELHLKEFNEMNPNERIWFGGVYIINSKPYEFCMIGSDDKYHFESFTDPKDEIILEEFPYFNFNEELTKKLYMEAEESDGNN